MTHLPALISDLALILITAGITTILFKWLKQPLVLGYIVAGVLISPHFVILPSVADPSNVQTWADIGVIFLLFALGLEFSFKKLMTVGGTAGIATLINMGSMIIIGYLIGGALGWTQLESLFLGGMLSMSSTTIIIKAFNDMGLQKKKFANIVFGMLIVEDLAAILMMVLLGTVAVSSQFEGSELLMSALKLVFFMLIWFVVGIYLLPTMFKKLKKYMSDETLLIVAIGLCLGMVMFANGVGFSSALGAFIMGSILAETTEVKRIEHLVQPLKDLFGAVFFVSVGMMIAPDIVAQHAGLILMLTAVVLVGRVIFATLGVMASGEGLKVAVHSGFSLAQIGEFSFIIATLGTQLGVLSDFIYPVIVAVSVITTFTTPYFIKLSDPIYNRLERVVPKRWVRIIDGYSAHSHKSVNRQSDWKRLLKSIVTGSIIYFVLAFAVVILAKQYLYPFVMTRFDSVWGSLMCAVITLGAISPFLAGIVMRAKNSEESKKLWNDNHFNRAALIALEALRVGLAVVLIWMVLIPIFPGATVWILVISIIFGIGLLFMRGFRKRTEKMEQQFFDNLADNDDPSRIISNRLSRCFSDNEIHIEEYDVSYSSPSIGKTLAELNYREVTGVNVVCIIRGSRKINIPDANERIYPHDRLVVAGSDENLQALMSLVEKRNDEHEIESDEVEHDISLSHYDIETGSPLIGQTVKEANIQGKTECLVVAIEFEDTMTASITHDTLLREGDTLWLAGEKEKLDSFENNLFA